MHISTWQWNMMACWPFSRPKNAQLPFTATHRLRVARLGLAMNKSK